MTRKARPLVPLLFGVLVLLAAACDGSSDRPRSGETGQESAVVPSGWQTTTVADMRVAYPPDFEAIPTQAGGPTRQLGVPYTGQSFPPPLLQLFVERQQVGSLEARVPLTKAQIEAQLGIKIGGSKPVDVAGARKAVAFSYEYRTQGGQTTSGDTLEPTRIRQTDLLIDVPGLPKYGLRFAAPAERYDQATWERIVDSIRIGTGDSATG